MSTRPGRGRENPRARDAQRPDAQGAMGQVRRLRSSHFGHGRQGAVPQLQPQAEAGAGVRRHRPVRGWFSHPRSQGPVSRGSESQQAGTLALAHAVPVWHSWAMNKRRRRIAKRRRDKVRTVCPGCWPAGKNLPRVCGMCDVCECVVTCCVEVSTKAKGIPQPGSQAS